MLTKWRLMECYRSVVCLSDHASHYHRHQLNTTDIKRRKFHDWLIISGRIHCIFHLSSNANALIVLTKSSDLCTKSRPLQKVSEVTCFCPALYSPTTDISIFAVLCQFQDRQKTVPARWSEGNGATSSESDWTTAQGDRKNWNGLNSKFSK